MSELVHFETNRQEEKLFQKVCLAVSPEPAGESFSKHPEINWLVWGSCWLKWSLKARGS